MDDEKQNTCRKGLQPGMIVKDKAGLLKQVTRIENDKVYWRYTEKLLDTSPQDMVTDYEEFSDTHYITPMRGDQRKSA
ncbi:MAG TPA: hypothetical protein VE994_10840 [Terriglobales bacterium]|nr:hypothetical protein [Terriglobales bacterium]